MEFRYRRPSPRLAGFVEILWYWEGPRRPHDFERLLPDGSMELIVNLREDEVRAYDRRDLRRFERLEGCILTGPRSEYFVIDTDQQTRVLGVHFRPGGAFPFLRLPADELHCLQISLSGVWGSLAPPARRREGTAVTARPRCSSPSTPAGCAAPQPSPVSLSRGPRARRGVSCEPRAARSVPGRSCPR